MSEFSGSLLDSMVKLSDGRRLQYLQIGGEDGTPVFHFHGNGSSRFEGMLVAKQVEALGLRLVCLDRPGVGLSDPKRGYKLLDWPDDVAETADQLGTEHFAVEGFSGGGPYALACAYKIPNRLTACALISPYTGPFMSKAASRELRVGTWLVVHLPRLIQGLERLSNRFQEAGESGEKKLLKKGKWLADSDERLLSESEVRKAVVKAFEEGSRQQSDADAKDARIVAGPWGFRVEEIVLENIFLFQGEKDHILPAADARVLAQAIPHCRATFYSDEAHLSTFVNHAQEIWNALTPPAATAIT